MTTESVDRRALAALRFVHGVTRAPLLHPVRIEAPGLTLVTNRSGLVIVREAVGFEAWTAAFLQPPLAQRPVEFTLDIHDPRGQFLPRRLTLTLPKGNLPDTMEPVEVPLLPAAAAPLPAAWAVLRLAVHVEGTHPPQGLANVWVEAQPRVPGKPMRLAQTDAHGEALVVVPDIGPVVASAPLSPAFALGLTLVLDPDRVHVAPDTAPLVNPDQMADRRGVSRVESLPDIEMRAGATRRHTTTLHWP